MFMFVDETEARVKVSDGGDFGPAPTETVLLTITNQPHQHLYFKAALQQNTAACASSHTLNLFLCFASTPHVMDIDDILRQVDPVSHGVPSETRDLQALTRLWVAERSAPELLE